MKKELTKKESIKIKCPLCKSKIPSNALRCSKCSGDLNTGEVQDEIQTQLQKQRKIKIVALTMIAFSIFIISISSDSENTPTQQVSKPTILTTGDDGILNNNKEKTNCDGNSILASSKENYDAFSKAQAAEDKLGYMQMLGDGKLFLIKNCTKVKIIDATFTLREVRLLEGEHMGASGWIPFEFVVSE